MQSTYITSTIYAVRSKGSASLSINDYSNFLCERFDRTSSRLSSSCCCCCDCCAYSSYRVPINPSTLFGLRQSALLRWSSSGRVILNGLDRYLARLPVYGINRGYSELNCSVKEGNFCNRSRRAVRERCYCAVSDEDSEIRDSVGSDDVDAVLNLLIEEAYGGFIDATGKNVSSFKRLEAEKKRKVWSREKSFSSGKKVVEKKGILKHHVTLPIEFRKEDERSREEREAFIKGENRGRQRDASSCSSYYSLSSSGDFGSDVEVRHKQGQSTEELSLEYESNMRNHQEEEMKEEYNWQKDDSEKFERISNPEKNTFGADIDWNLRKKSEKKLTDVTVDEDKSRMESQDTHLRVSRTRESSYGKSSISQKQSDSEEEDSSLVIDMDKKTRKEHLQTEDRRNYRSTELQEFGRDEVETIKKSQKAFSGREGILEISKTMLQETDEELLSSTTGKDVINQNSRRYTGKTKLQDTEGASNTRMKHLGENKFSVSSSVQDMEEQHRQRHEEIVTQVEERRKSHPQQFSELSKFHKSNENVSITSSRARIKNWEDNPNLSSNEDKTCPRTNRTPPSLQPMEGSEFVSVSSEICAHDENIGSSPQRTSDWEQFSHIVNTRESHCQTDERITQFEQNSAAQRPINLLISGEATLRNASSFQGSMNLVSEASISTDDERNSEIMFMPSSSRLVARGSTHIESSTSNATRSEVLPETSESSSSAMYSAMNPPLISEPFSRGESDLVYSEPADIIAPEDSLDSGHRLEQSSAQFVDEFVEKVRHEARTTETLAVEATGTDLVFEERNRTSVLRQKDSQSGSKLQDHGSNCSSGGSGTKGPSDEMWDVMEPSDKQIAIVDEPEISVETEKPIVKRSGRSLWNIISDIVHLRWGSRTDASTSAARSGDKSSSNKSDSEMYFSGHEHEEVSKSNVKMEKTSVPAQVPASSQAQPGKPYTQSEVEASDPMKSKDKGKDLGVDMSLSSNILQGKSPSEGISAASGEESTTLTEDVKNLQATRSSAGTRESSISLPAGGPPFVKESTISGISGTPIAESLVPLKIPAPPMQTDLSSSGRKDGELKQRKLQRKQQVARDRFDEWEEAYNLELEQRKMDEMFMREALLEAKKAADTWEVPVGAVLVQHGKIIARGCNLVEELRDSTAHAEMICIREASKVLRSWRLAETTLYVTLEPCPMCAGAILQARIDTVVWGAPNKLIGADGSWVRLFPDREESGSEPSDKPAAPVHPFHPKMTIRRGILALECADVMQQFFQLRRKKKEQPPSHPSRLSASLHPSKFFNKMHGIFHMMFCL